MKKDLIATDGWENKLDQLDFNINIIRSGMVSIVNEFFEIGKTLSYIKEHKLFKLKNYKNFIEFCKTEFDLSKNQAYNFVAIYERFDKDSFKEFSYSQLTEMLSLSDNEVKEIKSDMSVNEIREVKKNKKNNTDDEIIGEQTIIDVEPNNIVDEVNKSKKVSKQEIVNENINLNNKIKELENENAELLSKISDLNSKNKTLIILNDELKVQIDDLLKKLKKSDNVTALNDNSYKDNVNKYLIDRSIVLKGLVKSEKKKASNDYYEFKGAFHEVDLLLDCIKKDEI